ncbi:unnamed protein product [Rotaria sp. Silwood2]|nr:unnamed protein product [Rotaria sp. Silwood2]CAF2914949.1 unnamed protein product [Rotaria sp. Silwood2]CAF3257050.1 unnamed protein product [Rotaria sp. Silwood2]CAF4016250.1 unnamed protein product [Rotaria sp. Silwood2]CAF4138385.1 unnamed protein product [Rotaria sp. Silwood2]
MLSDVMSFVLSCSLLPWDYYNSNNCTLFQCNDGSKCLSRHRLMDGNTDCTNGEDEYEKATCSFRMPYRHTCDNGTRCIPLARLTDENVNCADETDEKTIWRDICWNNSSGKCSMIQKQQGDLDVIFRQICNGIVEQISGVDYHTDETDCNVTEWSCLTSYNKCNGVWNCINGQDELNCSLYHLRRIHCKLSEHFCLDARTGNILCLPLERAADNIIDCVGSSDERQFCRMKYPIEHKRRYRCQNSDLCILVREVCDCHQHCPENDDETIACKWINNNREAICDRTKFRCRNGQLLTIAERCTHFIGSSVCIDQSHELFCDLVDVKPSTFDSLISRTEYTSVINNQIKQDSLEHMDFILWHCNNGLHVQSSDDPPGFYCFCPPEYYGDRCQFQRKRLIFTVQVQMDGAFENLPLTFKIAVLLVRDSIPSTTISHDQFVYVPHAYCLPKYEAQLLYLINESSLSLSSSSINHSVHIHLYNGQTLEHHASWYFPIPFEFLPVNRMTKRVIVPTLPAVSEFSHKKFHNTNCTLCSNNAVCLGYDMDIDQDICVCSSNFTGRRCLIPFDECTKQKCNGHGKCISIDARLHSTERFMCLCDKEWAGNASTTVPR